MTNLADLHGVLSALTGACLAALAGDTGEMTAELLSATAGIPVAFGGGERDAEDVAALGRVVTVIARAAAEDRGADVYRLVPRGAG